MEWKWVPLEFDTLPEWKEHADGIERALEELKGKTITSISSYNPSDGDILVINFDDGSKFSVSAGTRRGRSRLDCLVYFYG